MDRTPTRDDSQFRGGPTGIERSIFLDDEDTRGPLQRDVYDDEDNTYYNPRGNSSRVTNSPSKLYPINSDSILTCPLFFLSSEYFIDEPSANIRLDSRSGRDRYSDNNFNRRRRSPGRQTKSYLPGHREAFQRKIDLHNSQY
jgi:hypothetical protein